MVDCQIIGDSIAVGVGQQLTQCRTQAGVGITAQRFNKVLNGGVVSDNVLISLGSNGPSGNLFLELTEVRSRITSTRVVWLVPANNTRAADTVRSVARQYGDSIIGVSNHVGRDGVHPTHRGYASIANQFSNR